MAWKTLSSKEKLQEAIATGEPVVVFKHSTRCSVSSMAKRNLAYDFAMLPNDTAIYYLDLIALRDISDYIAERWQVRHESPQLLVLQGDTCLYHASHQDIDLRNVLPFIS